MGSKDTADWDSLIDSVFARLEAAENNVRRQGQAMAEQTTAIATFESNLNDFATDIVKYKEYVESAFVNCSNNIEAQLGVLARRLNGHDTAVTSMDHNFAIAEGRFQSLTDSLEELKNSLAQAAAVPRGPDFYELNTPTAASAAVPQATASQQQAHFSGTMSSEITEIGTLSRSLSTFRGHNSSPPLARPIRLSRLWCTGEALCLFDPRNHRPKPSL